MIDNRVVSIWHSGTVDSESLIHPAQVEQHVEVLLQVFDNFQQMITWNPECFNLVNGVLACNRRTRELFSDFFFEVSRYHLLSNCRQQLSPLTITTTTN